MDTGGRVWFFRRQSGSLSSLALLFLNTYSQQGYKAYAPAEDAMDGVKDDFYQQLSGTFDELPSHDIKFLLGDFNARVGRDNSFWTGVIGKEVLHYSSNNNGL